MIYGDSMKNNIIDLLYRLGLSTRDSLQVFHPKVRDRENLNVLKCGKSGVIVLEEILTNQSYYESNVNYTQSNKVELVNEEIETRPLEDDIRRFESLESLIADSDVLDFGCGRGGFLQLTQKISRKSVGIELNEVNRKSINGQGIDCVKSISQLSDGDSFDLITLHHVFEHLIDPIGVLNDLQKHLKDDGVIVVEVPHARDLLLETFNLKSFKDFTFWSEHLILHTEESLATFARESGLVVKEIKGFQRYPVSNHFNWLLNGEPSGHDSFSHLNNLEFHKQYEKLLVNVGQTDTIIGYFGV